MVPSTNTRALTRQAADELLTLDPRLAPEKITVDKIYAVIQQGSRTTINDELKAWRVDKSKPEVPKEVLDLWSGTVKRAEEVFAQDRECMEAEVAETNRQADELRSKNEALRREADSREVRLKEKSDETENLRLELLTSKSEAEKNRAIARVNQEAAERAFVATRERAEYAERAAREVAENLAAQRAEHAKLESELRQEFRSTSDRQIALIDKVRLDFAQSVAASRELENHLGAARTQSENMSREMDRVNAEATQLKVDLAAARIETDALNREVREITRALHAAEIDVTRLQTALQAKEEALQVEITRRAAAENAVGELRVQIESASQNAP